MLQTQLHYLKILEDDTNGVILILKRNMSKEISKSSKYLRTVGTDSDSNVSVCIENELLVLKCKEIVKKIVYEVQLLNMKSRTRNIIREQVNIL